MGRLSSRSLTITAKGSDDPTTALRQVERWSQMQWNPLTLSTGFVPWGPTSFRTPGFCIDSLGFVHLRGLVKSNNAIAANTPTQFASVPISYAPAVAEIFIVMDQASAAPVQSWGRIDVDSNGAILVTSPQGSPIAGFISVSGILWTTY